MTATAAAPPLFLSVVVPIFVLSCFCAQLIVRCLSLAIVVPTHERFSYDPEDYLREPVRDNTATGWMLRQREEEAAEADDSDGSGDDRRRLRPNTTRGSRRRPRSMEWHEFLARARFMAAAGHTIAADDLRRQMDYCARSARLNDGDGDGDDDNDLSLIHI